MTIESVKPSIPIYPERPTMVAMDNVEVCTLDGEVRKRVLDFEKQLFSLSDEKSGLFGLEHIYDIWKSGPEQNVEVYTQYIESDEGKIFLRQELSLTDQELFDVDATKQALYRRLNGVLARKEEGIVDKLKRLTGNCKEFYQNYFIGQISVTGPEGEVSIDCSKVEGIQNPDKFFVITEPDNFIEQVQKLRKLKRHLKTIEIKEGTGVVVNGGNTFTDEERAMNLMIDIHKRKCNSMLAGLYSNAVELVSQLGLEDERIKELVKAFPALNVVIKKKFGVPSQRGFPKLDMFLHGQGMSRATLGKIDGGIYFDEKEEEVNEKDFTVLNSELLAYLDSVDDASSQGITKDTPISKGIFAGRTNEELSEILIDAPCFASWVSSYLREVGLLSVFEYNANLDATRNGPAEDDKWQVIIDPSKKALGVNSKSKIVRIPAKFDRSINQKNGGALQILDHEMMHIIQHTNKEKLGLAITQRVGMDRSSITAEAGAEAWEKSTQLELFEQESQVSTNYLAAARARLQGNDYRNCVIAFYNNELQQDPSISGVAVREKKAIELAVDRVQRLFRNGGDFEQGYYLTNSQPLFYVEQEILATKLVELGLVRYTAIGGTNVELLQELEKMGLIDTEKVKLDYVKPSKYLERTGVLQTLLEQKGFSVN